MIFPPDILNLIFSYPILWSHYTNLRKVCRSWMHAIDHYTENNKAPSLLVCLMEGYTHHFIQHYLHTLGKDDLAKCKIIANLKRNRELSIILRRFKTGCFDVNSVIPWFYDVDDAQYFEFITNYSPRVNYGSYIEKLIDNDLHQIIYYAVQNNKITDCPNYLDQIIRYACSHQYKELLHLLISHSSYKIFCIIKAIDYSIQTDDLDFVRYVCDNYPYKGYCDVDLLKIIIANNLEFFRYIVCHIRLSDWSRNRALKFIIDNGRLKFIDELMMNGYYHNLIYYCNEHGHRDIMDYILNRRKEMRMPCITQ